MKNAHSARYPKSTAWVSDFRRDGNVENPVGPDTGAIKAQPMPASGPTVPNTLSAPAGTSGSRRRRPSSESEILLSRFGLREIPLHHQRPRHLQPRQRPDRCIQDDPGDRAGMG